MFKLCEIETTIDSVNWAAPLPVRVCFEVDTRDDELGSVDVFRIDTGEKINVTEEQKKDIIEDIWDAVRQEEM